MPSYIGEPLHDDPNLPAGWVRKVVQRQTGETAGHWDVYIFSPEGKKFRSSKELRAYLQETGSSLNWEDFDFSKKGKGHTTKGRPSSKPPKKTNRKDCSGSRQRTKIVATPPPPAPPASSKRKSSPPKAKPPTSTHLPKKCRLERQPSPPKSESSSEASDAEEIMRKGQTSYDEPQSESNMIARPKSNKSFTNGAIVKIHLKDFMTYNDVYFTPGPNLNLILGPNGTKSTIVSAIYLGMNGKPSLLDRATTLGAYVRHGATKATIDIELYNPDGPNHKITREITAINNKSTWKYQGKYATEDEIIQLIKGLCAQVDNLHQFLTQEQVHNFSRMNDKELLIKTMKAVGNLQMEQDFVELKKMQDDLSRLVTQQDKDGEEVRQLKAENACFENEVKNCSERAALLAKVKHLEEKKTWMVLNESGVNNYDQLPDEKKALFNKLPDSTDEIEDEMRTAIRALVQLMGGADANVVRDYEERESRIQQIGQINSHATILKQQIEQKKNEFLPAILDLVSRINDIFSRYYTSIRCAGEVMLYTGENQDDFENYGIKIRVQYRSEEPFIELSANHHSDGEISLATALYMLAMQEISHVPFCCVDEINQGMDPFNERGIFDVLVQTARHESSAQYFLLTPKFKW